MRPELAGASRRRSVGVAQRTLNFKFSFGNETGRREIDEKSVATRRQR
jgi:hypothetical protein